MSDKRFHLTVTFEVYGKQFNWAPDLNWSAEPCECDARISNWFADCYELAYDEFHTAKYEAEADQRMKDNETSEREQLSRLRAKYPDA